MRDLKSNVVWRGEIIGRQMFVPVCVGGEDERGAVGTSCAINRMMCDLECDNCGGNGRLRVAIALVTSKLRLAVRVGQWRW